jgi:hypothetical protein
MMRDEQNSVDVTQLASIIIRCIVYHFAANLEKEASKTRNAVMNGFDVCEEEIMCIYLRALVSPSRHDAPFDKRLFCGISMLN